ncbi:hypothetical protein BT63DRAFT_191842 [Microthyrium microscopicum]|uniref:RNI-like protein n=1 Tax=Microthyrium microscopicum TaxID=703497 RepID=A0A6A6UMC6_9PEZI|nr:hypothetical protein BT63DRAFT_191842 [Microthyrium microscopicum]
MAPRGARSRATRVSYRELSFDNIDEDDASFGSDGSRSPPTRHSTRASRQKVQSLKELSSDEGFSGDESESGEEHLELPAPKRRRLATRPIAKRTRAATAPKASPSRRRATRPAREPREDRPKRRKVPKGPQIPTDGISPLWHTLPYEVMLSIFDFGFALYPTGQKAGSSWLAGAAKTCKDYSEPALAALYRNPPLYTSTRIELFFGHMMAPTSRHFINYHSKVKRLEIDERCLGTTFDLVALVKQLPQLAHLNIWSPKDHALRGNATVATERYWQMPTDLISEIGRVDPPLKSWNWNMKMMPVDQELDASDRWKFILNCHQQMPLSKIKHLTLTNFNFTKTATESFLDMTPTTLNQANPEVVLKSNQATYIPPDYGATDPLSTAIQALPRLRNMRFEYCDIVTGPWLNRLPSTLTKLDIHCCHWLRSEHLQAYLEQGNSLKTLVLDHNPSLDLNFLQCLKKTCPHLEDLRMELIYFDPDDRSKVYDTWFDNIINETCVPTWPSSLIHLEILHLRHWEGPAAEMFFKSIIDSSQELPNLRHLEISASVGGLGWKQRATFRDQWVSKFEEVFLRVSDEPSPHLVSKRAYRQWNQAKLRAAAPASPPKSDATASDSASTRRLRPRRPTIEDEDDLFAASLKSRVFAALKAPGSTLGMCEVVNISIGDQRPRTQELRESDLLDSEPSGDEDYE